MKKGKTSQIEGFDNIKCIYGTVDSKELKSIYVILQGWIEPLTVIENTNKLVSTLKRHIKHILISSIDYSIFKENFIIDLDLRSSGIQKGKRSFLNLEINLFLLKPIDFKSPLLKEKLIKITNDVYKNNLLSSNLFTIHLTKNKNKKIYNIYN
jgi:hypothetical protein